MSTKTSIYTSDKGSIHLYEENSLSDDSSPAFIHVSDIEEHKIQFHYDKLASITLSIPANIMDELAIRWCKHRKLHGALGSPVGREWGSPDYEE